MFRNSVMSKDVEMEFGEFFRIYLLGGRNKDYVFGEVVNNDVSSTSGARLDIVVDICLESGEDIGLTDLCQCSILTKMT